MGASASKSFRISADRLLKFAFSFRRVVIDFLRLLDDRSKLKGLERAHLVQTKSEHVDRLLAARINDVVWRVRLPNAGNDLYIMIEFQTRSERTMCLRIAHYALSLYESLVGNRSRSRKPLPWVAAFVVYRGKTRWTAPRGFDRLASTDSLPVGVPALNAAYLLLDMIRSDLPGLQEEDNIFAWLCRLERIPVHDRAACEREISALRRMPWKDDERGLLNALVNWGWKEITFRKVLGLSPDEIDNQPDFEDYADREEGFDMVEHTMDKQWTTVKEWCLKKGREEGREEGEGTGRWKQLLNMVEVKFGEGPAQALEKKFRAGQDETAIDAATKLFFECRSANDLLTRLDSLPA